MEVFFLQPGPDSDVSGPFWGAPSAFFALRSREDREALVAAIMGQPQLGLALPGGRSVAAACGSILEVGAALGAHCGLHLLNRCVLRPAAAWWRACQQIAFQLRDPWARPHARASAGGGQLAAARDGGVAAGARLQLPVPPVLQPGGGAHLQRPLAVPGERDTGAGH